MRPISTLPVLTLLALLSGPSVVSAQSSEPDPAARPSPQAWGDIDGDGLPDLYLAGGAAPDRLFRNLGNGHMDDVTVAAGLAGLRGTRQALFADFDRDDDLDLLLLGENGTCRLYRALGALLFEPVEEAIGFGPVPTATAARWLDYDGDGWSDLLVERADGSVLLLHSLAARGFEQVELSLPPRAAPQAPAVFEMGTAEPGEAPPETPARATDSTRRVAVPNDGAGIQSPGNSVASSAGVSAPSGPAGLRAAMTASAWCAPSLEDIALPGNCVAASSLPTIGTLYPLGPEFNIATDGKVGIGTTSPTSQLHLSQALDSVLTIEADTDNSGQSDNAQIRLLQDGGLSVGRFGFRDGGNELELVNEVSNGGITLGTDGIDRFVLKYDGDLLVDGSSLFVDGQSGRVGIGTTTPSTTLDVNGNMEVGNDLVVVHDLEVDGDALVVESFSNRVGIGTDSPSETLDIVGSLEVDMDTLYVDSTNDRIGVGTKDAQDFTDNSSTTRNVVMVVREPTAPTLRVHADDGNASSLQLCERGTNNMPYGFELRYTGTGDRLDLWSRGFYLNEGERMTWLKNGNVGIGTTSPQAELDVVGTTAVDVLSFSDGSLQTVAALSSGMRQGHSSTLQNLYLNTWSDLEARTINCPAAGHILAIASCEAEAVNGGGSSAKNGATFTLSTTSMAVGIKRVSWEDWVPPLSTQDFPVSLQYVFPATSGPNSVYFTATETDGQVRVVSRTLTLVYLPESY